MKAKKKRWLASLLAVAMVLAMLPSMAFAADINADGNAENTIVSTDESTSDDVEGVSEQSEAAEMEETEQEKTQEQTTLPVNESVQPESGESVQAFLDAVEAIEIPEGEIDEITGSALNEQIDAAQTAYENLSEEEVAREDVQAAVAVLEAAMETLTGGIAMTAESSTLLVGTDQTYTTLNDAISNANPGDTIKLMNDLVALTGDGNYLIISKDLTIDLNTHTVSKSGNQTFTITGGNVEIINGSITATGQYAVAVTGGSLNITNCTVAGGGIDTFYVVGGNVNLRDATITSQSAGQTLLVAGGNLTAENCVVACGAGKAVAVSGGNVVLNNTSVTALDSQALLVTGTGTLTMDGGNAASQLQTIHVLQSGTAVLNGCSIKVTNHYGVITEDNSNLTLTNCTVNYEANAVTGGKSVAEVYGSTPPSPNTWLVYVLGGTVTLNNTDVGNADTVYPVSAKGSTSVININGGTITGSATNQGSGGGVLGGIGTQGIGIGVYSGSRANLSGATVDTAGGCAIYSVYSAAVIENHSNISSGDGANSGTGVALAGGGNTLTVKDSSITYGQNSCGIQTNGTYLSETIILENANIQSAEGATKGTAVYLPAASSQTAISGGTLMGPDAAVEIRGGTLEISGASLKATNEAYTTGSNGSGTTASGAALAVAPYSANAIDVTINDGIFEGTVALSDSNPNSVADAKVTLCVKGGSFSGKVTAVNEEKFISGGIFTNPVPEGFCAEGFEPATTSDAMYPYTVGKHELKTVDGVDATCTEDGFETYWQCSTCGKMYSDEGGNTEISAAVIIPAKGHSYGTEWKSDETGHWHACSACGDKTDAANHSYGEWAVTKAATETEKGEKQRACSVCGYAETAEIPVIGTDVQMQIVQTKLTEVPAGLTGTSFNTVAAIENELIRVAATHIGYTAENTVVSDVKLQISTDGGKTWFDATEDNFPASGITIVLPYPNGTGRDTHDFVVTHMFTVTSAKLGTTAGETETPAVKKLDSGIQVTLKGLSPVSISWKAVPASTGKPVWFITSPQTGDSSSMALWAALLAVSALGLGAAILYGRKRRSSRR